MENKKARVILLNPPTAAESSEVILSLAYLASSLRKGGHEVKVIDATAPYNKMSPAKTERAVLDFAPNFIGVTLTITYIPQSYAYLEKLREIGIPIVVGGSHVNPLPGEAVAHGADIVALGEGENTIVELADYFTGNNTSLENIKGLCWRKEDGSIHATPPRPLIENLDEIPFPSFEDFPIKNYTGSEDIDSNPLFWAIFSSRGCPFNCTFCCGYNVFGRTYRLRTARNIFNEIKSLVDKFGVRKITFQDDEILLSKKRIMELCDLVSGSNIKIKMSVRSRMDSIENDLLKRMKEVGFRRMSFGIESWNGETLKNIKKRYTPEDIKKGLNVLDKSNFPCVNFNTIVGFPWETCKHLEKNLEAMSKIPKSIKFFSVVVTPIPYPNTELYNTYHKEFGFTDWWLKPGMHCCEFPYNLEKPLFFYFAKMMTTLYIKDPFWNYTVKKKEDIERFTWKVFRMYSRRHLDFATYIAVYLLARLSYAAWKRSPHLEGLIFRWVPKRFVKNIEKKLSFTKQA